jgi:hypothetical protein
MTPTLWLAVLLLAAGAPAPKDTAPPPIIVGEWATESVTVGGRPSEAGADRWRFEADGTWSIFREGKLLDGGPFERDAGGKGALDLTDKRGSTTNLCRYKLDADTLILSVGHGRTDRPKDIKPGPGATVWVLKRVKDK